MTDTGDKTLTQAMAMRDAAQASVATRARKIILDHLAKSLQRQAAADSPFAIWTSGNPYKVGYSTPNEVVAWALVEALNEAGLLCDATQVGRTYLRAEMAERELRETKAALRRLVETLPADRFPRGSEGQQAVRDARRLAGLPQDETDKPPFDESLQRMQERLDRVGRAMREVLGR